MKILSARYVLPVSGELIENGAAAIEKEKIVAVGALEEINERFPETEREYFGEAVILPGFVNTHSHLEITAMRGFLDDVEENFYSWLIKLTKTRAEKLDEKDIELSALLGAVEGVRAGVTCFGDIGRMGSAGFEALKKTGLRGVLFQETEFSPDNKTAGEDFEKLKDKFLRLRETETALVEIGLSPHAPYTVSRKLFEKIADYAVLENVKITIHAAESIEEQKLMIEGTGFFAEIYKNYGYEWRSPHLSSVQYLNEIGVLRAAPLLAHCVKVTDGDLELIKQSDSRVAHCPKSNAKFGHGIAPLEKFLDKQIKVGFGSDSVASNNACDILEEARFAALLARNREGGKRFLNAKEMIETVTIGGAKALGLEDQTGTLEAGKQADITIVSLESAAQQPVHDVYSALLFASNARDVRLTMVAGEEVFRDGDVKTVDENEIKVKIKEAGKKMQS